MQRSRGLHEITLYSFWQQLLAARQLYCFYTDRCVPMDSEFSGNLPCKEWICYNYSLQIPPNHDCLWEVLSQYEKTKRGEKYSFAWQEPMKSICSCCPTHIYGFHDTCFNNRSNGHFSLLPIVICVHVSIMPILVHYRNLITSF